MIAQVALVLALAPAHATPAASEPVDPWRIVVGGGLGLERAVQLGGGGDLFNVPDYHLGVRYQLGPTVTLGVQAHARLYAVRLGPTMHWSLGGADRSGPVLGGSLAWAGTGIWCNRQEDCPPTKDAPPTTGQGGALVAQPGWRFTWREGRRALSIGTELSGTVLRSPTPGYTGVYLGGFQGLQFTYDT